MAKARKTWKLILTSVILSILVLAAFTAVFITIIVPSYSITKEQIYNVLTKALPILIGLIFIEIALVSSRRGDDDYKDNIDKLSPNAYDSPLYTAPVDDPHSAIKVNPSYYNVNPDAVGGVREVIKEVPVEVVKEVIKEVPVEIIREVPVEVEKVSTVEVPVVKEVVKEVPVEVIKEVEVPVIKEVPVERIVERRIEVPVEVLKEVEVPVVKEVVIQSEPVTIIKESVREVPVTVIKEVEVQKEVPVEVIKEVEVPVVKEVEKPVTVIKEITKEVPVEVIREVEVPVEVVKEVEVPVEVIKEVPVEVIKEVPVEVIKEVEVPVEVVKEVPVEVSVPTEVVSEVSTDDVELSLNEALQEEMDEARKGNYPLVLVGVKNGEEKAVADAFDCPVFVEEGVSYAILPFTRLRDVAQKAKDLGGKAVQMAAKHTVESIKKEASK